MRIGMMKMSNETKLKAHDYFQKIKKQIEFETGIELGNCDLTLAINRYEMFLHNEEKIHLRIKLEAQANELGLTLVAKPVHACSNECADNLD